MYENIYTIPTLKTFCGKLKKCQAIDVNKQMRGD